MPRSLIRDTKAKWKAARRLENRRAYLKRKRAVAGGPLTNFKDPKLNQARRVQNRQAYLREKSFREREESPPLGLETSAGDRTHGLRDIERSKEMDGISPTINVRSAEKENRNTEHHMITLPPCLIDEDDDYNSDIVCASGYTTDEEVKGGGLGTDSSEGSPLTMEERIDMVELDMEYWLPMLFYKRGRLGPFVWSILEHCPETFSAQTEAIIAAASPILTQLFELGTLCIGGNGQDMLRIQSLTNVVQKITAGISIRVAMVDDGLIEAFPGIVDWEQPRA